jgi:hypothetical protein
MTFFLGCSRQSYKQSPIDAPAWISTAEWHTGLVYEGADLEMSDLEAKAQWKLDLIKRCNSDPHAAP